MFETANPDIDTRSVNALTLVKFMRKVIDLQKIAATRVESQNLTSNNVLENLNNNGVETDLNPVSNNSKKR